MKAPAPLAAFAAYGIELEYMIVDRDTLAVRPLADRLLRGDGGDWTSEVERGLAAWSNELVLHVVELKNPLPTPDLSALAATFQSEICSINQRLAPLNARLMPTAAHPWMKPRAETRLWPHAHADIYRAYDRIFDCRRHGWANLQSMHLNLPFADDAEFARLHAAARLVLPILPALAASSPILEGKNSGFLDARMEAYRAHQIRIPATIGRVIPDTAASRADYEKRVLAPMYRDLAPHDPEGVLRQEWLNARGAIPRFTRNALEIRVIDVQECPRADLAVAAAATAAVRCLYRETPSPLAEQQAIATEPLVSILHATIRDAELAVIADDAYLRLLGYPGVRCEAHELWRHLLDTAWHGQPDTRAAWGEMLDVMLARGPLARRILRAVGPDCSRRRLEETYRALCDCLETGRMFDG